MAWAMDRPPLLNELMRPATCPDSAARPGTSGNAQHLKKSCSLSTLQQSTRCSGFADVRPDSRQSRQSSWRPISRQQRKRDAVGALGLPGISRDCQKALAACPLPVTFEELYSVAKGRVAKVRAFERQASGTILGSPLNRAGGACLASLPSFPSNGHSAIGTRPSSKQAAARPECASEDLRTWRPPPVKASAAESEWAADVLFGPHEQSHRGEVARPNTSPAARPFAAKSGSKENPPRSTVAWAGDDEEDLGKRSSRKGSKGSKSRTGPILHTLPAHMRPTTPDVNPMALAAMGVSQMPSERTSAPSSEAPSFVIVSKSDRSEDNDPNPFKLPDGMNRELSDTSLPEVAVSRHASTMRRGAVYARREEAAEPENNVRKMSAKDARKFSQASLDMSPGHLLALLEAQNEEEGFSEREVEKMSTAFGRFKCPGQSEMHKHDLPELLQYLGHVMTSWQICEPLLVDVIRFDYMDLEEFMTFMEKYVVFEMNEFRRIFEEFDEDGSGEISADELRSLTKAIGFMPRHGMIREALQVVDADGNGELDFDELQSFLKVYRHAEGFTHTEVTDLRVSFDAFAKEPEDEAQGGGEKALAPEAICDALVEVLGLQASEFAQEYADALASGKGLQKSSQKQGTGEPESLKFGEFLILARKVREAQFEQLKEETPEFREDLRATIDEARLREILTQCQYTPLKSIMAEISKLTLPPEYQDDFAQHRLDFDEFFDFMITFRQQDGFLKKELDELKDCFVRFDEDGSGAVDVIELSAMMMHLGHRVLMDDLRELSLRVDSNGSGSLDFREFVRLQRLFREQELSGIKELFAEHMEAGGAQCVPASALPELLDSLGHEVPPHIDPSDGHEYDFDEVVKICDKCRAILVSKDRRKAGFVDEEIDHFQNLFNQYDVDGSGDIDVNELQTILKAFDWEPRSKEEQRCLMRKLEEARVKAREAGVEEVSEPGCVEVKFWPFVQLMRTLRNEFDKAEQELLRQLEHTLSFSEGEVEEFRQIFKFWCRKMAEAEEDDDFEQDGQQASAVQLQQKERLSKDGVRRMIRSLGCSISPSNGEQLDQQISQLDPRHRRMQPRVDFPSFLKLMRWLLDTNFAGIQDASAKEAQTHGHGHGHGQAHGRHAQTATSFASSQQSLGATLNVGLSPSGPVSPRPVSPASHEAPADGTS